MATSSGDFRPLVSPAALRSLADSWLSEDCPAFDYGGHVVGSGRETAFLLAKGHGVLAGAPFFEAVFGQLDCGVQWLDGATDGSEVRPGQRLAAVTGRACDVLRAERPALNCLARASGVATLTRRAVQLTSGQWGGRVAGTRKTTPGFRAVEKYALLVGGADPHRFDLSAMVMLKDNHVWTVGDVGQAVARCRQLSGFSLKVEVECRSLQEALQAAEAGADVIMLDNFTPKAASAVAKVIKGKHPQVILEVSGGVNLSNLADYFDSSVDVISMSQLTQGYPSVDFSLKILRDSHDPNNPVVSEVVSAEVDEDAADTSGSSV